MPRFYNALLGALALHGLLLLVHSRRAPLAVQAPEPAAEQSIDIDETPLVVATGSAPSGEDSTASPTAAVAANETLSPGSAPKVARSEPRLATSAELPLVAAGPSSDEGEATGVAARAGDGEGEGAAAAPEKKIDLGLDGHFFLGPPSEMLPRIHKPDARPRPDPGKRLQNALAADDVQRGLARGNALVGSLNSAARDVGPVRGEAMFRVTVGADGGVLSAELLNGAGGDWSAALSSFRALAAQKRLRVPPGARGLRVTFSVRAKVQRPSGKEVEASPVGLDRPSLAPNGLVPHGDFDMADLGGGGQRLVYARVVSEEVL